MMSEVLSYLIMITCILIRVSSKEVKWTVRDTPPKLGQNLTLFCKVDNCTVRETKRWHGGPDDKVLMLNSGISTDKTKYSTSIEKNGFILTILNLTVKDLNISYTCSCGLDLDDHILYIEDVYTVDNLNKTTNGTNYIGTNDLGGISLYVYIAIPVAILVILLIIVIVVSKRHWLSRRLNGKTDDTEKSNTEDCNPSAHSADTCYSATESLEPSASRKDSDRIDSVIVPLIVATFLDPNPGNMNQVPPVSYIPPSSPSPKLVQDTSRPQSEKTSLTNKPEIITSEMENHSSSSTVNNSNDTSALQQAIERPEDQIPKLEEELEFYKSHQTDNTGPYHTDTEKQVEKLQSDNDKLQEEIDDLKRTNHRTSDLFRLSTQEQQQVVTKIKSVEVQIEPEQLKSSYSSCKKDRDLLKTQPASGKQESDDYHNKLTELETNYKLLQEQTTKAINELRKKYQTEMKLRKKYHNELVELKGNIRVFCRVRPKKKEEDDVVKCDEDNDGIIFVSNKGKTQEFKVDKVFSQTSLQEEVFDEVKALITSCIDGYNVCIFAYGQTGSGKTYTMEGPTSNPGINPRALNELFNAISAKGDDWSFTIEVSFIEIYNEIIRDLLIDNQSNKMKMKCVPGPSPEGVKMEVRTNSDGVVYVPDLSFVVVKTAEDVKEKVLAVGKLNRTVVATTKNENSSRSHALLCVTVTGVNKTTNTTTTGKLNLVDLAGSERASKNKADVSRLEETKNINKSLLYLRNALYDLISKKQFVQYRDSNLTFLLKDSLGGNSKTLMIVQVAPAQEDVAETMNCLTFAQSVRSIELGHAIKKIKPCDVETVKTRAYRSSK